MKFIQATLAAALVATLGAFSAPAQAQATGYVNRLEVHVGTAQVRFRVDNSGTNQVFCGSNIEAFFPLTAGTQFTSGGTTYTWTQNVIDTLKSLAVLGRAAPVTVDVYTVINGSTCMVIDIVVK